MASADSKVAGISKNGILNSINEYDSDSEENFNSEMFSVDSNKKITTQVADFQSKNV